MTWKLCLWWLSEVLDIWTSPLPVFIMGSPRWGFTLASLWGQKAPWESSRAHIPGSVSQDAPIMTPQAAIFGHQVDCSIWYCLVFEKAQKGIRVGEVWFLECFNFCISWFLFFSVGCQTHYWISLGYEQVEGQTFKHIQELLTQPLLCSCPGLTEVERTNKYSSKAKGWAKGWRRSYFRWEKLRRKKLHWSCT